MKKFISALLCAALIIGATSSLTVAFAAKDGVKFSLSTDIHIESTLKELEVNYPESELYFQAGGSGNLYDQAPYLTKQFLKNSVKEGVDFILLAGDLTRNGNEEQHRFTAKLLSDFEEQSGVQIYVVPGNHDYFNSGRSEFKDYYYKLGYDNALTVDEATASYTADVADGYRLIAVDSNDPGEDGDGITPQLISWIKTQVAKANEDGRKIIYMMHHPLLEHLPLGKVLMKNFMVRNSNILAELFCRWGIEYVFTGHEHGNDIKSYTSPGGSKVYDVLTTALSSYPVEYRMVEMNSEGADIKMRSIDSCDISSLIPGYTAAQKAMIRSDYEGFTYGLFKYAIEKKILHYTSPEFIKGKLKAEKGPLADEIDILFDAVNTALTMPLYDDGGDGVSMEKLAAEKGVEIPKSDYKSLIELVSTLVAHHYYGNENLPAEENPECEIVVKGLNTGLEYVLTKCGRSGIILLEKIIGTTTGLNAETLSPVFRSLLIGKESSYVAVRATLYPLLNKFLVDSGNDRDTFLPA